MDSFDPQTDLKSCRIFLRRQMDQFKQTSGYRIAIITEILPAVVQVHDERFRAGKPGIADYDRLQATKN